MRRVHILATGTSLLLATGCTSLEESIREEDRAAAAQPDIASSAAHSDNVLWGASAAGAGAGTRAAGELARTGQSRPRLLWYGGQDACALGESQLQVGGSQEPSILVDGSMIANTLDVAVDTQGRLWVVGSASPRLYRFDAPTTSPSGQPDLIVESDALQQPGNLALDHSGSLWVANRPRVESSEQDGSILRFDIPENAAGKISLDPAAEINASQPGDLQQLGSLSLDDRQSLWVTSSAGLVRYDNPRGLSGRVAPEPDAVVDTQGYAEEVSFYSVAFDQDGSLWAASADGDHYLTSVTKFERPNAFDGRQSPEVAAQVLGPRDALPSGGLTLDDKGNLWLATSDAFLMYRNAASFAGIVDPSPDRRVRVSGPASPTAHSHLVFHTYASGY